MNNEAGVDISEYNQVLLVSLKLPDNYAKLIRRITKLNGFVVPRGETFSVNTIGELIKLEPHEFAKCPGIGKKILMP